MRATDPPRARPSARRRTLTLGVALVVGCTAAACSGTTEPDPTRSVETSEEPSPTRAPEPSPTETGPVKPERPAAMDRDDAEGAAAAAEYYIELYPYVMATGDLTDWNGMAHGDCAACAEVESDATRRAEKGDSFVGGALTAVVPEPEKYFRDEATGIFPLDVDVVEDASTITSPDGDVVHETPASKYTRRIEIGRNSGSWVVVEISEVPQP
ncbi:hypothetical protein H1Q78_13345 [Cellulosimicrobium cellulans]|uniref:DUF6318 family protein n=1 Tax=Cellulosimicrobium cellulans TaxID=1710 RepID=UPI001EDC6E28|nr:DUF6318 family protein [Cellulosimicrobium cellulans]UKJ62726.1 hypothetical protein H1Q78_13345 [Cellulosimicrobium cellulans]